MKIKNKNLPIVYISSTVEDLKPYRQAVKEAAIRAQFLPSLQEYFAVESVHPPLQSCLYKVEQCDVLLVIIAYRYGWIPEDQPRKMNKSITWLECEHARSLGKEILAFVIDPDYDWSEKFKEEFLITKALNDGRATPELLSSVQNSINNLREFKKWIELIYIRDTFTTPQDLQLKTLNSLFEWKKRHASEFPSYLIESDPTRYLQWLYDDCSFIDIRGLQVETGKAHKFGIEEVYVPLTTSKMFTNGYKSNKYFERIQEAQYINLDEILNNKKAVIIGDPGSGKTTFCRHVVFNVCKKLLGMESNDSNKLYQLFTDSLPIFIRLGELTEYIRLNLKNANIKASFLEYDPKWIINFLEMKNTSFNWGLSSEFFKTKFESNDVLIVLDGLDEIPDRLLREKVSRIIENLVSVYKECSIIVTSRPQAYVGSIVLKDFFHFHIEPLGQQAIEKFLFHWSKSLFYDNEEKADIHFHELIAALRSRSEIARMARNPLMLTALAVVHWNERRLPEQRADMYESIITWLLRSRGQRPGRVESNLSISLLSNLALAMQQHCEGRQVQVGIRWASEAIESGFSPKSVEKRIEQAEYFLTEETLDSGIVVSRGNNIAFWHLTFQEYLAAKALGGKTEQEQNKILINKSILYNPDWREVLLLFVGILFRQGLDKLNQFFSAILIFSEKCKTLADQTYLVGLIGAMLRDLAPYGYTLEDKRYKYILKQVMSIFDVKESERLPLNVRLEAADALGQSGDPRLNEDNIVVIPDGSFMMGSQKNYPHKSNYDSDAFSNESPVHIVHLTSFRVNKYLVTVQNYQRFIDSGGYDNEIFWPVGGYGETTEPENWNMQKLYPNRPVVGINWYEAKAYSKWAGGDLPSEAQWERIAKGPSNKYMKYPWGDKYPSNKTINTFDSMIGHPSPVGMFPYDQSSEGIYDLAGNVAEWCLDWFDYQFDDRSSFYEKSKNATNPINNEPNGIDSIENTTARVVRGSSWNDTNPKLKCRCAFRHGLNPGIRNSAIGFRIVFPLKGLAYPKLSEVEKQVSKIEKSPLLELATLFFRSADFFIINAYSDLHEIVIKNDQKLSHKKYGNILVKVFEKNLSADGLRIFQVRILQKKNEVSQKIAYAIYDGVLTDDAYWQMGAFKSGEKLTIVPLKANILKETLVSRNIACFWKLDSLEKKYLSTTFNRYEESNAIDDPTWFFGRLSEIDIIINRLNLNQHAAVFGMRKNGKTSLLLNLKQRLSKDTIPLAYIGLQSKRIVPEEIFADVVLQIRDFIRSNTNVKELNRLTLNASSESKISQKMFKNDIISLWSIARQYLKAPYMVLIMDEIERIVPNPNSSKEEEYKIYDEFFSPIRDLSQINHCLLTVIASEKPTIRKEFKTSVFAKSNTMFELYNEHYLPFFNYDECSNMIRSIGNWMGMEYSSKSLEKIFNETSGHPYIARILCSCLTDDRAGDKVSIQEVNNAIEKSLDKLYEYFRGWWENITIEEKNILNSLIKKNSVPKKLNQQELEGLRHLSKQGIVKQTGSHGENPKIALNLLKLWLSKYLQ